jgi:pimeloyl-ACP methyl ester carboxylesterase
MTEILPKPNSLTFHLKNGCLRCEAWVPHQSTALVILTHGTGTYRSNRNLNRTIKWFYDRHIAILATDLLTSHELSNRELRLNTELVTQRIMLLISYLRDLPVFSYLPIALLGVGTGADGALSASARIPHEIKAVAAVNGLDTKAEMLKKVFPATIPALVVHQDTLGQQSTRGLTFPAELKNIRFKKIFKSDDSTPCEAIEEATNWLTENMLEKRNHLNHNERYAINLR